MAKKRKKLQTKHSAQDIALQSFRRRIHNSKEMINGLAGARKNTPPGLYPSIVNQLGQQRIYRHLFAQTTFPKKLSEYVSRKRIARVSTEGEIMWSASVLSLFTQELSLYVKLRDKFYSAYFYSNHEEANELLNEIQENFGYSLWLIGHRLQLLQNTQGLQAQKDYLEEIISTKNLNQIVTWLSYYLSLRAENSVTFTSFESELFDLLTGGELSDYVIRKILPYDLTAIQDPGSPISWDEPHSVIDRFETFIAMTLLHFSREGSTPTSITHRALQLLAATDDKSILRALSIASGEYNSKTGGALNPADLYTQGRYHELVKSDDENLEIIARAQAILGAPPDSTSGSLRSQILNLMYKILIISQDIDQCRTNLKKLALQCFGHSYSYQISAFLERSHDHLFVDNYDDLDKLTALNSPTDNPWNAPVLSKLSGSDWSHQLISANPGSPALLLREALLREKDLSGLENIKWLPTYRLEAYKGHAAVKTNDLDAAIEHYKTVINLEINYISEATRRYLFEAYMAKKDLRSAVYLIIDHIIKSPPAATLYPLEKLCLKCLEELTLHSEIGLAILLHAASKGSNQRLEREISDIYENILESYNTTLPTQLLASDNNLDEKHLTYFLRHVCVPRIMDDTTHFDSVDEIDDERIRICQQLLQLDKENSETYLAEIRSITRDTEVSHLLAKVQTSKIFVDEDGVKQALEPAIKSFLPRYKQLLNSPNLAYQAEKLSKILADMLSSKGHPEFKDLKLPATELESLFSSMLIEAIAQFSLNPAYGLDTHVSTSIRHGAFEGHLRSPLAVEDLLCSSSGEDSKLPQAWSNRLNNLSQPARTGINKSLVKFTQRFEALIATYLKEKLHIKMEGPSMAMFSFEASPEQNQKLMQSISSRTEHVDLMEKLLTHCWELTLRSLDEIQNDLRVNFSQNMSQAFDALARSVDSHAEHEHVVPLLDAIARARTSFEAAINDVAEWFQKPTDLSREPFDFDIAVQVALRQIKNCYIKSTVECKLDLQFSKKLHGSLLDGMCEILFILLQNVIIHSELEDQKIAIDLTGHQTEHGLIIECRNKIGDTIPIQERRNVAEEAMGLYERDSALRMARQEGGSGLSKVWRIAEFDLRANHSIHLSVSDTGEFSAKLTLTNLEYE